MSNREYKLLVHTTVSSLIEEIGSLQKDGWLKSATLVRSGDDFLQVMHRYSWGSNEGGRSNVSDFVDKMSDLLKEDRVINIIKAAGKSEADLVRSIAYPNSRPTDRRRADWTGEKQVEQMAGTAQVLKGIGKKNGDGFKDTTKVGETVFVWNAELPKPYAPGQFPRVGAEHWSASTEQYDFCPATVDEVRNLLSQLLAALLNNT